MKINQKNVTDKLIDKDLKQIQALLAGCKFSFIQRWDFQPDVRGVLPGLISLFTVQQPRLLFTVIQNDCKDRWIWKQWYILSETSVLHANIYMHIMTSLAWRVLLLHLCILSCPAKMGFDYKPKATALIISSTQEILIKMANKCVTFK